MAFSMTPEPFDNFAHWTTAKLIDKIGTMPHSAAFLLHAFENDKDNCGVARFMRNDPPKATASTCVWCEKQLLSDKETKEKHVITMGNFVQVRSLDPQTGFKEILNGFENALLIRELGLEQVLDPDLSKGPKSIAARVLKPKQGNKAKELTFEDKDTEKILFFSMACAKDSLIWHPECGMDLEHYTYARLYSTVPHWRKDPYYVVFSLHRLIAFGKGDKKILDQLPAVSKLRMTGKDQDIVDVQDRTVIAFGGFAQASSAPAKMK